MIAGKFIVLLWLLHDTRYVLRFPNARRREKRKRLEGHLMMMVGMRTRMRMIRLGHAK